MIGFRISRANQIALNDDGQMTCSYVIIMLSKSAWVELVSLKDDCSWRIEMYRFCYHVCCKRNQQRIILKEEQRTAIKAFVDLKDVLAKVEFISWHQWSLSRWDAMKALWSLWFFFWSRSWRTK